MKRITVFCGSNFGTDEIYEKQAFRLGEILAQRHIGLVYGGANVGLMNSVAEGSLSKGGEVTGVLPVFIKDKGIAHKNLTELILVNTMHERKTKMNELSDGVIALPGGFGTLEEFFETLTWAQLGLHRKPAGLLNINGYYDSLKILAQTMVENGFLKEASRKMLLISDDIDNLIDQMESYIAPGIDKWIIRENNLA
ncbi:MAG TPA: TIGR00730 family Rossman fold protein [Bacteroidales bacterium]|nr:TIGR00730 family Rossman fold protein [Bacteroidales bacterium]HBZ21721.1 TIGR00730 family Rossman fold protein [Bacteroidales bacterium]